MPGGRETTTRVLCNQTKFYAVRMPAGPSRNSRITEKEGQDENIQGLRRFLEMQAQDQHLTATAVQTVGAKNGDGFSIARVNESRVVIR